MTGESLFLTAVVLKATQVLLMWGSWQIMQIWGKFKKSNILIKVNYAFSHLRITQMWVLVVLFLIKDNSTLKQY